MSNAPVLWGPNNTATNLENSILNANGQNVAFNGSRNYLPHNSYKFNSTTWMTGTIGTLTNGLPTGTPTFGSGAAGTLSVSTTTALNPSIGTSALQLVSTAATTVGNMIASPVMTIDTSDQAKVITFKDYYSTTVGASTANYSGNYATQSIATAFWDVTNSVWLGQSANFGYTQSTGVGYCTGSFQTNVNTTQIRKVIYFPNATTAALTMLFDDFTVGPQTAPIGYSGNDDVAWTPVFVGFGTVTGINAFSRKVGNRLEGNITFTAGTVTATIATISLGFNGANGNVTAGAPLAATGYTQVGNWARSGTTTAEVNFPVLAQAGSGTLWFAITSASTSGVAPANASTIITTGETVSLHFSLPITGFSSNVQTSADSSTAIICSSVVKSGTQALSAGTPTKVTGFTVASDASGMWDPVNNWFKTNITGYYRITTICRAVSGSTTSTSYRLNGTTVYASGPYAPSITVGSVVTQTPIPAGTTIEMIGYMSASDTVSAADTMFQIERLSGPGVIAQSESVNMRYQNTAGTTIGTTAVVIPFPTKFYDSHGEYNTSTGNYTVAIAGKFKIDAKVNLTTLSSNAGFLYIYQNGSMVSADWTLGNGTSNNAEVRISDTINCLAGDQIAIYAMVQTTGTTLVAAAGYNIFSIERVGN